jgi:dUTPase
LEKLGSGIRASFTNNENLVNLSCNNIVSGREMMEVLSEAELVSVIEQGTYIKDGSINSCEGIKYDFTLSSMALTVDSRRPRNIDQYAENAVIRPGEIAYVMTKESLDLPGDVYCQLSTKRKLSLDGIVLLGGLIIDPMYQGKLIFGLYNLSSREYPLLPGRKLVAGVFYKVDKKTGKRPEAITDFPDDLIKIVVDTKPNSASAINAAIGELREELRDIKNRMVHDEEWKKDFQNGLTAIQHLVERLGEKLDAEIDTRQKDVLGLKEAHLSLKDAVVPMVQDQKKYRFWRTTIIGLVSAVVAGLLVYFMTK